MADIVHKVRGMRDRGFEATHRWNTGVAGTDERTNFIHRTYQHLALAIGLFIGVEALLLQIDGIDRFIAMMTGGYGWLVVLGLFMAVSYVAQRWAQSAVSRTTQYLGLGLFVVAEAIIFLPLLYIASHYAGANVIPTAAVITGVTFGGLTISVLASKRDFSFLGGILRIAGFAALGLIVASLIFGFSLGLIFSFAMAIFAAGSIVYETSNIQRHYNPDQHVAAALGLFASVALLFWYILRIVMSMDRD